MKKLTGSRLGKGKQIIASMLCAALLFSVPGKLPVVTATQPEEQTTAASAEVESDINGKLGKNTDVGIEVTKSITGTPGKKLKITFKLKSLDKKNIKLNIKDCF